MFYLPLLLVMNEEHQS